MLRRHKHSAVTTDLEVQRRFVRQRARQRHTLHDGMAVLALLHDCLHEQHALVLARKHAYQTLLEVAHLGPDVLVREQRRVDVCARHDQAVALRERPHSRQRQVGLDAGAHNEVLGQRGAVQAVRARRVLPVLPALVC